jgi:hypothetical protein
MARIERLHDAVDDLDRRLARRQLRRRAAVASPLRRGAQPPQLVDDVRDLELIVVLRPLVGLSAQAASPLASNTPSNNTVLR